MFLKPGEKMTECPKCNSYIEDDSDFCDQCGSEIFYRECVDCKIINRPIAKFCSSCGGKNLIHLQKDELLTRYNSRKFG